jgi:hypothetical protein
VGYPTNRESFDFYVGRLANQRAAPIADRDLSGARSAAKIWQNQSVKFSMQ